MSEQQQILTIDDMTSAYITLNNKGAGMCIVEFTPQEHQAGYPADCTLNMTPQEIYEAIENGSTVYARCVDPATEFEGERLLKVFCAYVVLQDNRRQADTDKVYYDAG